MVSADGEKCNRSSWESVKGFLFIYYGGDMFKRKKKDRRNTKAIGSEVSIDIWNELKVQAIREGRKTGEVLDDAIKLYLEKIKGDILGLGLGYPFD